MRVVRFGVAFMLLLLAPAGLAAKQEKTDFTRSTPVAPVLRGSLAKPAPLVPFPGGSQTFTGQLTVTDSTFNRTVIGVASTTGAICGALSGGGTAVFFDTFSFTNTTAGAINVSVRMTGVGGGLATFNTYLHVYSPTFNPASGTTNCIRASDDGPGGIGTSEISGVNAVPIPIGAAFVVVADSFYNGEVGAYGLCVTDQVLVCTQPVELQHFRVD